MSILQYRDSKIGMYILVKWQGIVAPNGLTAHLLVPVLGHRQNSWMLDESGISDTLEDMFSDVDPEDMFSLFGDPAYPLKLYLVTRLRGIDEDRATFNVFCLSVREFVEWNFGDAVHYWAIVDLRRLLHETQAASTPPTRSTNATFSTTHRYVKSTYYPCILITPTSCQNPT